MVDWTPNHIVCLLLLFVWKSKRNGTPAHLSIALITVRGTGTETCGIGSVFPPDRIWIGSDTYTNCTLIYDLLLKVWLMGCASCIYYTPATKLGGGGILDSPCLSVRLSVCPLTFRVHPVASTVQDGFFPYLVQIINSMRGCVACDDLWPWPISSRSLGLDLENRVRSVASVLDGFFSYFAQMITIFRGCVACYGYFKIWKFEFFANFWNFSALTLEKKIYSSRWILSIFSKNDH